MVLARFRWFQLVLDDFRSFRPFQVVLDRFRSFQVALGRFSSFLALVSTGCAYQKKSYIPNCNRSFKRKDHFEKQETKCSTLENETEAEDLPSIINSFEVSSLLQCSILLSIEQEAEQVNNETSDQITENVHI